jgi:hypothetical protein
MSGRRAIFGRTAAMLAVAAAAWLTLSGDAAARLIPRAEKGGVTLIVGAPEGLARPIVVKKGDIAWTQTVRPRFAVRLLQAAAPWSRPNLPGLPEGAILFGWSLPSGMAYCPAIDYRSAVPDVQCLRDLDEDRTFDAGYVMEWRGHKSRLFAGVLDDLNPVPHVRYERVPSAVAPQATVSLRFDGFNHGVAVFAIQLEGEWLQPSYRCSPAADGLCKVLGLALRVTPQGEDATIELAGVSDPSDLTVIMAGGPDIAGFDKPSRPGHAQ